jgi:hypothetical protein
MVAARDESAAADVYASYEAVRTIVANVCAVSPTPPLLLAIDDGDEPLLSDPLRTLERVTAWQREHVDSGEPPQVPEAASTRPDLPTNVLTALARTAAGAVPAVAPELALPATWRDGATWCFVMPTENAIAAATDAALDYGIEQADISFVKRALIAPFMPLVRSRARDELRRQVQRQLLDAMLAALGRHGRVPAGATDRCLRELGFDVDPPSEPPSQQPTR